MFLLLDEETSRIVSYLQQCIEVFLVMGSVENVILLIPFEELLLQGGVVQSAPCTAAIFEFLCVPI
jgi:hypothetical protein